MRYWDDFISKYGFSDDEAIPSDAKVARSVYVRAINTKAEKLRSTCRVIPYNRPGMHNAWVIVSTTRGIHNQLTGAQRVDGTDRYPENGETKDDAMAKAIARGDGAGSGSIHPFSDQHQRERTRRTIGIGSEIRSYAPATPKDSTMIASD
jgi:hypothetical protein